MNPRHTSLTILAVFAVITFVCLMTLTINSRQVSDESYETWRTVLRQLSRAGTALDAALLSSLISRQPNYDELTALSHKLRESSKRIESLSDQKASFLEPVLNIDGTELVATAERHSQLVFDFQTELSTFNAASTVFLNSVHEFISRIEETDEQSERDMLVISLMRLEEKLLITSEESLQEKRVGVEVQIAFIKESFPEFIDSNRELWDSIVDDAQSILRREANLDLVLIEEKEIRASELKLISKFLGTALEARIVAARTEKLMSVLLVIELLVIAFIFIIRSRKLGQELKAHAEQLEETVADRTQSLQSALKNLQESSEEKEQLAEDLRVAHRLEAIGQLAAGIAHEINTPTQFVGDNLNFMNESFQDRNKLFLKYKETLEMLAHPEQHRDLLDEIKDFEEEIDLEFLEEEMPLAMTNAMDGVKRISKIVKSMKDFSHPGSEGRQKIDINKALETTLNVAKNEWKYVSKIERNFDENLPAAPAYASELNQVLLNIIVNSSHAIEKKQKDSGADALGLISIETGFTEDYVSIGIRDNGCGIPQENIDRVFDPFFTTKEVGKGTGQGLSIARKIIADKHKGKLTVNSQVGEFTEFNIFLPRLVNDQPEQDKPPLAEAS